MEPINYLSNVLKEDEDQNVLVLDPNQSVVFFLFDLTQCEFYYAGGAVHFKGHQASDLLKNGYHSLKEIVHPQDFNYLLRSYKNFSRKSHDFELESDSRLKWTTEIRIITNDNSWSWVEANFDVLSYNKDNSIGKVFCTLKDLKGTNDTYELNVNEYKPQRNSNRPSLRSNGGYRPDESHSQRIGKERAVNKLLGAREVQVLRLIANGLSDRQIAQKLEISVHTSVRHRKNLIEKFKVKNTAELIKDASKVFWL